MGLTASVSRVLSAYENGMSQQKIREKEAEWLRSAMNRRGLSNSDIHAALKSVGFEGQESNVTMWKTGRTAIPNEWLVEIIKAVAWEDPESLIIEMYSRRLPYLKPYFKKVKKRRLDQNYGNVSGSERPPTKITFFPKHGKNKGIRHVPHTNRHGKFQGGVSRFARDIEEFDSISALWNRIQSDPDFKVRMSPEDRSGPPSLVRRESLVIS